MKQKIGRFVTLFMALTLALAFAGCDSMFSPPGGAKTQAGTGVLYLSINGSGSARTILPKALLEDKVDSYTIEFAYEDDSESQETLEIDAADVDDIPPVTLKAGEWTITATAFIGNEAHARKTETLVVTTKATESVNFVLEPIAEGAGSFSWDIVFPTAAESGTLTIVEWKGSLEATLAALDTGDEYDFNIGAAGGLDATDSIDDLDAGVYLVVFTFTHADGRTMSWPEILVIYNGLDSEYEADFEDFEFPAEPLVYTITGTGTSFTTTKNGAAFGTAGQSMANTIAAIKTDADGEDLLIIFGSEDAPVTFNANPPTFSGTGWGIINLSGYITASGADTWAVRIGGDAATDASLTVNIVDAVFNSAANNTSGGTVVIMNRNAQATVTITDSTIINTSNAGTSRSIIIASPGGTNNYPTDLTITDSTIVMYNAATGETPSTVGRTIYNGNSNNAESDKIVKITLDGTTKVIGGQYQVYSSYYATGVLAVTDDFAPETTDKIYIGYGGSSSPGEGGLVVKNGAAFFGNFEVTLPADTRLMVDGDDICQWAPATFTVTFNTKGGVPATIDSITVIEEQAMAGFPDDPTKQYSTFAGWFEGTTQYTADSAITKDTDLVARWTFVGGTPEVVGNNIEHVYPLLTAQNTAPYGAGGAIDPATNDGNLFFRSVSAGNPGAYLYQFPEGFVDYDFVSIEWEMVDKNVGRGGTTDAEIKLMTRRTTGNTQTDYNEIGGGAYPNMDRANKEIRLLVSGNGGTGGFAMAYNNYQWEDRRYEDFTIKITKITMIKAAYYDVTFYDGLTASNEGKGEQVGTPLSVREGGTLASSSLALPGAPENTVNADEFLGWVIFGTDTAFGANTAVNSDLDIVAKWGAPVPPVNITIDFTEEEPTVFATIADFNATYNTLGLGASLGIPGTDDANTMNLAITANGLEVTNRTGTNVNRTGIDILHGNMGLNPLKTYRITVTGTRQQAGILGFCFTDNDPNTANPGNGTNNVTGSFTNNQSGAFSIFINVPGDHPYPIKIMTRSWEFQSIPYTISSITVVEQ